MTGASSGASAATLGPLQGLRVLEIGRGRATPLAARLLGDLGADVTKVESAEGDPVRAEEPFYHSDDGDRRSALFEYLNWDKTSVLLDPRTQQTELRKLIQSSDVVFIGDDLALLGEWGVDPGGLHEAMPDLVVVTVTPYGTTGPSANWSATDLTLQASSGIMTISGTAERGPLKRGLLQSSYEAALSAAYVAEAGVLAARRGAGGTFADISMSECMTSELVVTVPEYTFIGALSARRPASVDPFSTGAPLPAGDGYVTVQTNTQISPADFVDLVGDERLADPRFLDTAGRALHAAELEDIVGTALAEREPRGFFVQASQGGLLSGFVQTAEQLLSCPQLEARQVYVDMPGRLAGRPWKMPTVLPALRTNGPGVRPAPLLGQHTAEMLHALGVSV